MKAGEAWVRMKESSSPDDLMMFCISAREIYEIILTCDEQNQNKQQQINKSATLTSPGVINQVKPGEETCRG